MPFLMLGLCFLYEEISDILVLRMSPCAGFSTLQQLQPGQQAKYSSYLPQVHGVLYQLDKQDLPKLTKKEGGYQLVDIEVRCDALVLSAAYSLQQQ
jgi:hypothetical protein